MTCSCVCISHATGAGGEEVGRLVAERLGFLYVDDEIVARAATSGGVDPEDVVDEERRKSLVARVLDAIAQGGGEAWSLGSGALVAGEGQRSEDLRLLIRDAIAETAARGQVVIVAHGASHVVPRGRRALRVLVTASPATRTARLREVGGLDEARAARAVKQADAARRDYLKRFYDVDEELPTHYDLVVNTDLLSFEEAAELVAHAGAT